MHKLNLEFTSFDSYSARVKILCMCMQHLVYVHAAADLHNFCCHVCATLKVADFSSLFPRGHSQQSNPRSVTSDLNVNIVHVYA